MSADQNPGKDRGIIHVIRKLVRSGFGQNSGFSRSLDQVVEGAILDRDFNQRQAQQDSQKRLQQEMRLVEELKSAYAAEQDRLGFQAETILDQFGIRSKLREIRKKSWLKGEVSPYYSQQSDVKVGSIGIDELKDRDLLTGYCLSDKFKVPIYSRDSDFGDKYYVGIGETHLSVNLGFFPPSYKILQVQRMTGVDGEAYIRKYAPFIIGSSYVDKLGTPDHGTQVFKVGSFSVSVHDTAAVDKLNSWLLNDTRNRIMQQLLPVDLRKKGQDQINVLRASGVEI